MRIILSILTLLFTSYFYSQTNSKNLNNTEREVIGFVFQNYEPLPNVSVKVKGIYKGTTTNKKGFFKIKVKKNEIIQFSHIGYNTITILVEDVTKVLNIKLKNKKNQLDEIVIKAKVNKKKSPLKYVKMGDIYYERKFPIYIKGSDLNQTSLNPAMALVGKYPGLKVNIYFDLKSIEGIVYKIKINGNAPIWDVNGVITKTMPKVTIAEIKSIVILTERYYTMRYGDIGRNGVIVINTIDDPDKDIKNINSKNNPYTNQEYYDNNAVLYKELSYGKSDVYTVLKGVKNEKKAFTIYQELKTKHSFKNNFYMDVLQVFIKNHPKSNYIKSILTDFEKKAKNNSEIIKSIAYKYQELKLHDNALLLYKKVLRLRPTYAQSYRDLANAYLHLKQYKNAWKIYKHYLSKGFSIDENGIGNIIKSEMKAVYFLQKKQNLIKDKLAFKDLDIDDTSDIRLVFEWNTSEAEFNIEFVNQNSQSYTIHHTLFENSKLITDEKKKGYSSRQYNINPFPEGEYQVNITYFGNKNFSPTFLKVTTYYNWGRINQTEKISVFQLKLENAKTQLFKINSQELQNNFMVKK